jgi:hypothetical protein
MDFGMSLDPLSVPQRHTLYDSDSDEEREQQEPQTDSDEFTLEPSGDLAAHLAGKALLVGVGATASAFLRSFVCLSNEPSFTVQADAETVGKGAHFRKGKQRIATAIHSTVGGAGSWVACAHPGELRPEYCNRWTEKVLGEGKLSHVVVFVCRSLHNHFSPEPSDEDHTHVVRELQSSSWPHPPVGVSLEAPNSVQGETAASE